MATSQKHRRHEKLLTKLALEYPGAHEEFPWGEKVIKVKGKIFFFVGINKAGGLGMTVKLPHSRGDALDCPFAKPTGYNLGKSGWVTASFQPNDSVPVDMLVHWLDESYRAVAPKKLVKLLDSPDTAPAKPKAKKKKQAGRR